MSSAPRLLLVEDDVHLSGLLQRLLDQEGYAVTVARDGQQGLHRALVDEWDVLVVDRGLPGIEGVDLVARLRARGVAAPVLLLTARDSVADRVEGLDAGAQDYLVKPFDVEELLARLRALLRPRAAEPDELPVRRGRLLVTQCRVVDADAGEVILSRREADLLAVLARRPTRVFTRDELLDLVFEDAETTGAVDTYVYYLRRKLGRAVVATVHGVGYRLGAP
ncbi:response regulator transcription factor [Lapillicoccus sp.]|uniref:response regulator transcription factor n=1 Tax=Lapillicoccus sp. TaxID=1909287 RepID=UPI003983665B